MSCTETIASCECTLDDDHDQSHTCECGGQWTGTGDEFEPVTMPGGLTVQQGVDMYLRMFMDPMFFGDGT